MPPVTPAKPIPQPVVKPAPVGPVNPLRDFAGVLHGTFAEAHAANVAIKAKK